MKKLYNVFELIFCIKNSMSYISERSERRSGVLSSDENKCLQINYTAGQVNRALKRRAKDFLKQFTERNALTVEASAAAASY